MCSNRGKVYVNKEMNGVLQEMMSQFYQTNHSMLTDKSLTKRKANFDKERKANVYQRRPMSVFLDNSRAVTNQTMCNDIKLDGIGGHKLSVKPTKIPLSQQNTIDRRNATYNKYPFRDIGKIQNKLEKNLYKLKMRSNISPDRNYSDATTATASHDERRISMYLRALEEVAKANPESMSLFMFIRENLEKLFHSLIYKKKEQNESISEQIDTLKKEISKEKKRKEKL